MNKTIEYYEHNAKEFANGTMDVNFTYIQDKFLNLLKPKAKILDFGCGSGRDTKYFLSKGFIVDATDGSAELCKIAHENTGIEIKQMFFEDLNEVEKYDGIWACSSILHLAKAELKTVIGKMIIALKQEGYIYTSFKYGRFEGERNGRYFTDFTEDEFSAFISEFSIKIVEKWVSGDVRPGRGEEKWLNLILQKN